MTKATSNTTNQELIKKISELKLKLLGVRLDIRAGKNKNTNAHKPLKKEISQLLTQLSKTN